MPARDEQSQWRNRLPSAAGGAVVLRIMLKFVVCVGPMVMLASVAFAHGTHPTTSDQNNDGTTTVYSSTKFGGDLRTAMNRWNALKGNAPKFRFTENKSKAELVVWKKASNDCWNGMLFHTGADEIWLAAGCSEWIRPALHELGHSLRAEHHECTSYWQRTTVMVSDSAGCTVQLWYPGSHDAEYYKSLL
jgi:hypothetical protein